MFKLLYLVHRIPYPPNRGDRIRSYNILKFLAARCEVHLACMADEPVTEEQVRALNDCCARVAIEEIQGPKRWLRTALSMGRGRSATEGLFHSPVELPDIVDAWTRQTRYDAALAYCSSAATYLKVPGLDGVPTVVDLVDVDSQKWFDYAAGAKGHQAIALPTGGPASSNAGARHM